MRANKASHAAAALLSVDLIGIGLTADNIAAENFSLKLPETYCD